LRRFKLFQTVIFQLQSKVVQRFGNI
jgi:hypothetical protein